MENAAPDPSAIVELGEIIEPIEFAATHSEEVELLEGISHIVHEVEEGEISPEEGLDEVKELVDPSRRWKRRKASTPARRSFLST